MENLQDFLDNFSPDTRIEIFSASGRVFDGVVKNLSENEGCLYWIVPEEISFIDSKMQILVEHQEEVNRKIEEKNRISYDAIFSCICDEIKEDRDAQLLFKNVQAKARDYVALRRQWNMLSPEELCRRNSERSLLHDLFIDEIDSLAESLKSKTKESTVWRKALGNERECLGDFAEYLVKKEEDIKEGISNLEAIIWAQEHHNQIMYLVDSSLECCSAKIQLMDTYGYTENQSDAIMDMRTKGFCRNERMKAKEDLIKLQKELEMLS